GVCITFPFATQSTPLLLRDLGVEPHLLGPVLTVAQSTEIVLLGLLPIALSRLGLRAMMLLGLSAWFTSMCVLSVGEPLELVVASLGLHGLYITGFIISGQVYVNGIAGGDLKASVQGVLSCINGLGLLIGNLLAGWLRGMTDGRLPPTFAVAAVIAFL